MDPTWPTVRRLGNLSVLLRWFRRLCIRWEIRDDADETFIALDASIIRAHDAAII
ncbi:hypothetical protein GCM10022224_039640 [Nonomuraea antimicrobica]|uniref:Transposase DDE domain-containing protein n=1 Tax=Nonomuraea antimicrobica TaxID=561173 RepID=A0ABP7BWD8_9ACTN